MFSLLSGSVVKQLADSWSLTSIKDQEQTLRLFVPYSVGQSLPSAHLHCALHAHHGQEVPGLVN